MHEVLAANGHTVRGFGPTTGSVRALQEAGVQAKTVASLLAKHRAPGDAKREVWIVDESSLLATRQVNLLLHRARDAQVALVIFVGNQRQHGAVEAGRLIAQLQQAGMETTKLDTIRRQCDPELRKAVALAANGETKAAMDLLISQGRVTEITDANKRAEAIAQEYARSVEAGQQVLVVSPANAERMALNATIRQTLQNGGRLPVEGIAHRVLVNRNITGAERGWARSYTVGDVLRYRTGSAKFGLAAGAYARVEAVDSEHNRVTILTEEGTTHTYSPTKLKGVEVYREEVREFVKGERIQFRAPFKEQKIPNGGLGRIEKLDRDSGHVTITLDAGQSLSIPLKDLRHIEYGYAMTNPSSQGATIDRVLVNIDTEHSVALVNQPQFYVSISRARQEARIFTNKREELSHVVSRSWPKATALDAMAKSEDAPTYAQRRDNSKSPEVLRQRHAKQQIEDPRVPLLVPASTLRSPTSPSLINGQPQSDTARLVSHRQRDWRRERQQPFQEQTVAHSLTDRQQERPTHPLQNEEPLAQKSDPSRGIRYRR
jgi:ATP-dependent exoDNAse (exonuclease V) alpha subunit